MNKWLYKNWFFPVAILWLGFHALILRGEWQLLSMNSQWIEAIYLLDMVFLMPMLYLLCYRKQGKAAVVKAVAIACSAIWLCQKLLPIEHQQLLIQFAGLRYVGLAGVLVLELKLIALMIKMVFSKEENHQEFQKKLNAQGMPNWLTKLVAFEAAFWRRVWLFGRRIVTKRES